MTAWFAAADTTVTADTALRLTAITLLLRPMGPWYVLPALLGLAASILISPRLLRTPATWLAIAALVALRIGDDWPLADNHIYLLAYWCLAAALALRSADVSWTMATGSRWLLGLAFALAVVWKGVLAPDFVDGRFFRVTVLTDPRFAEAARLIGGLTRAQLEANREALQPLPGGAELLDPPDIVEPWRLRTFTALSTWGVLALEIAVAAAFLTPMGARWSWLRPALLLAFCGTTYAFAPVAGFGWLLLAMGLGQVDDSCRRLRHAYVGAYLLVMVYSEVPWESLLGQWIGAGP